MKKTSRKPAQKLFDHPELRDPVVKPGRNTVPNGKGYFVRPMDRKRFEAGMDRLFGPTKLDLALMAEQNEAANRACLAKG